MPREMAKWEEAVRVRVFANKMFGPEQRDITFGEALRLIGKGQLAKLLKSADRTGLGHPLLYGFTQLEQLVGLRKSCASNLITRVFGFQVQGYPNRKPPTFLLTIIQSLKI